MKDVEDYKATVRRVRDQRQKQAYRHAEMKEALISWFFGLLIVGGIVALAGWAGMMIIGLLRQRFDLNNWLFWNWHGKRRCHQRSGRLVQTMSGV